LEGYPNGGILGKRAKDYSPVHSNSLAPWGVRGILKQRKTGYKKKGQKNSAPNIGIGLISF